MLTAITKSFKIYVNCKPKCTFKIPRHSRNARAHLLSIFLLLIGLCIFCVCLFVSCPFACHFGLKQLMSIHKTFQWISCMCAPHSHFYVQCTALWKPCQVVYHMYHTFQWWQQPGIPASPIRQGIVSDRLLCPIGTWLYQQSCLGFFKGVKYNAPLGYLKRAT